MTRISVAIFVEKVNWCNNECKKAEEKIDKMGKAQNSIDGYFESTKRLVDSQREELKVQIDVYFDQTISDIDKIRAELRKLSKDQEKLERTLSIRKANYWGSKWAKSILINEAYFSAEKVIEDTISQIGNR